MTRRASATLTGLLTAAFLAASVVAARAQATDPAADAAFQVGPLAFTPSFAIPAMGLDSNVFNESENPRDDFTADIQPAVDAWIRFGPARLGIKEQLNLIYFQKYASERGVNSLSRFNLDLLLLWATPHAAVSYVKTNDRPDIRIDTRGVSRTRGANAGIDFRLSASTNLDVGADLSRVAYDDGASFGGESLQTALDRDTRNYHAVLRYAVTPPTVLSVTVAKEEQLFRYSPEQNSESFRVVPGITLAADAVITGSAEFGWLSFKGRGGRIRPFTGLVSTVNLGYVLFGLTRFQVTVDRDVTPSIDSVSTYALQTNVTGTVTHRLTERWDVNASAAHLKLDFGKVRGLLDDDPIVERADVVTTYGAGIGFYFNQGLRLGVRAESISRNSPLPARRYDNLRILGSFSYALR